MFRNIMTATALSLALAGGVSVASVGPVAAQSACGASVTVRPGDTLNRISARCGVPIRDIMRLNNISNPSYIQVGQRLRLAGTGGGGPIVADPVPQPGGNSYVIRRGDTLASIARRYGVSLGRLIAANRGINPNRIRVGLTITIPGGGPVGGGGGNQAITVVGEVTDEGVECPTLRDDRGRLYTLAGNFPELDPGDIVEVRGFRAEVSFCQQGRTIDVVRLRELEDAGGGGGGDGDFVRVRGVLTDEGVECQALRSENGRLYTFEDIPEFGSGDYVEVEGTIAEVSFCQQGTTIEVSRIGSR